MHRPRLCVTTFRYRPNARHDASRSTRWICRPLVKLHLEGGELAALKGARQTLLTHRPVLAATVYHNADGIWETPHWLMDNLPDYRFLFRVHAWCGNGAVIYAIPRERLAP